MEGRGGWRGTGPHSVWRSKLVLSSLPSQELESQHGCDGFTTTHQWLPSTYRGVWVLDDPSSKVVQWNLTASSTPRVSGFCCAVMDTHLWLTFHISGSLLVTFLMPRKVSPHSIYRVSAHLTFRGSGPFSRRLS